MYTHRVLYARNNLLKPKESFQGGFSVNIGKNVGRKTDSKKGMTFW